MTDAAYRAEAAAWWRTLRDTFARIAVEHAGTERGTCARLHIAAAEGVARSWGPEPERAAQWGGLL